MSTFKRYVILGACNPPMAHQALSMEPDIGVLLPCNVCVSERDGGGTRVAAMNPAAAFTLIDNPEIVGCRRRGSRPSAAGGRRDLTVRV